MRPSTVSTFCKEIVATMPEEEIDDSGSFAVPVNLSDGSQQRTVIANDTEDRQELNLQEINELLERKVGERTRDLEAALGLLQESERSFGLLVRSITDYAMYMLDPNGNVVSWNAGAERIKGYDANEIIGAHFSCFYTDEDRKSNLPLAALQAAARDRRLETEGWRVRKDGSGFWAHVLIEAIFDSGELVGFVKITRDITEKRAAEARLRQAQKMEAVGLFTGGVAHDFNNLLMAISGSLELLRKRLPDDERMLTLLDNAMQGASRGAALTQRMLAFSRRQELKCEAVDLAVVLDNMREELSRIAGAAVKLDTRLPLYIPLVRTDASQLATALINLVQNARDAMPNGGRITLSVNAMRIDAGHPTALSPGHYVCLSLLDTGHGMDESTLARLGEPFFTLKGVGKGTGLGLFMVDGLATQSGGKLVARSRLGEGTTIDMWLPVAGELAVANGTPPVAVRPPAPSRGRLVVLAVDDDKLVLMNIVAMLEDLGHTVIDAESAYDALTMIDDNLNIDLVISDQGMPGMTGSQLAREIKLRRPLLPVIIATGYTELPGDVDPSLYRLVKPFTQHDLAEALTASYPVVS
jgi:PAS domain S-box-containing protein